MIVGQGSDSSMLCQKLGYSVSVTGPLKWPVYMYTDAPETHSKCDTLKNPQSLKCH